MASSGQDNQIKLWLILCADFLGVYSDGFLHTACPEPLATIRFIQPLRIHSQRKHKLQFSFRLAGGQLRHAVLCDIGPCS